MRKWIATSLMENLVETDWTKTNLPLRFKLHLGYGPQQKCHRLSGTIQDEKPRSSRPQPQQINRRDVKVLWVQVRTPRQHEEIKYFREYETLNFGGREFCGDSAFVEIVVLERYFRQCSCFNFAVLIRASFGLKVYNMKHNAK